MDMNRWTQDELRRMTATDDLHIAPFREDGVTYGTLTWIWSVVVDGNLYARAYNGTTSSWYKAAIRQKAGRITAAGMERNVAFVRADDVLASQIDEAYQAKYGSSPYLGAMIGKKARAATVMILPVKG
jgi:hypothetical protein